MTAFLACVVGILLALMLTTLGRRSGAEKLSAAIAHDQRILGNLPAGSQAAIQLANQVEAMALIYTTGWVVPQARRREAFFGTLYACMVLFAALQLTEVPSDGDWIVYPFVIGMFGTLCGASLSVVFHRNTIPPVLADAVVSEAGDGQ